MQYMLGEVTETGSLESEIHNLMNVIYHLICFRNRNRNQIEETTGNISAVAIRQPHFTNKIVCRIGP